MIKSLLVQINNILKKAWKNLFEDASRNAGIDHDSPPGSHSDGSIEESLENRLSHWNGYIRERAVLEIKPTVDDLDFIRIFECLLIRANDWVPEVRSAALTKLKELLEFIPAEMIIEVLPKVYRLQKCRRADHAPLISTIEKKLTKAPINVLLIGFANDNKIISRACFSIIINEKLLPVLSIIDMGIKSDDVVIKIKAARLLKELSKEHFDELYPRIYNINCVPVRREIIRTCAQFDSEVNPRILRGLLDSNVGVAITATYYAKKMNFNFKEFYLDILLNHKSYSQKQIYQAIYNIKETKIDELYPVLLKIFHEPVSINFRINLLKALVNYQEFDFNKEIVDLCMKEDPLCAKIKGNLINYLPKPISELDAEVYYNLLRGNYTLETKRLIVKILLRVSGFWSTVIAIMNIYELVSTEDFELLGLKNLVSNFKYKHTYIAEPDMQQQKIIQKWIDMYPNEFEIINLIKADRLLARHFNFDCRNIGTSVAATNEQDTQNIKSGLIMYSTPTVSNDLLSGKITLATMSKEPKETDFMLYEDDWAQIEFYSMCRLEEIKRVLKKYKSFEELHRTDSGWDDMYLRDIERTSIISSANPTNLLQQILEAKVGGSPILFGLSAGILGQVKNGFSLSIARTIMLYGYVEGNDIPVIGAYVGDEADSQKLVEAFVRLNASNNLILVDWRAQSILISGNASDITVWRP